MGGHCLSELTISLTEERARAEAGKSVAGGDEHAVRVRLSESEPAAAEASSDRPCSSA
jgi:hypothetical protein